MRSVWLVLLLGIIPGDGSDVVVLAGNVPLFTPPGTHAALVGGCARHVAPSGVMIAGFQLDRGYTLVDFDAHCLSAGLSLTARYASWDAEPYDDGPYAVSVASPA